MTDKQEEQFTAQEEIKVELTVPDPDPVEIITTKRKTPIRRFDAVPLKETHGMTTEANRFKET